MAIFKGFVVAIGEKSGKSSKGKRWTIYSAKIEKEDGTEYDKWISLGFDEPSIKKGDYVKITTETNEAGYENVVKDGIKKLKNAPARSGKSASGGAAGNGSSSTTQQSIHYQNSRNLAATVLTLLQEKDALPLSSAKTKAGEIKRYEEIMALLDKLTVRFFYDAETLRLLQSVVDEGKASTVEGDLPDDDEEETTDDEESDDDSDDEEDADDEDEESDDE
jgi:hypothetical protein